MRKLFSRFVTLCFLFIAVQSHAQRDTIEEKKILDSLVHGYQFQNSDSSGHEYIAIQIPATFRGGVKGWADYLTKNLRTELAAKYVKMKKTDSVVKQTVVVSFLVDKTGLISDVKADPAEKGVEQHPKLVAEAIRVIAEGPRWEPAQQEVFEVVNGKIPYDQILEKKKKGFKKVIYRHKQSITYVVTKE